MSNELSTRRPAGADGDCARQRATAIFTAIVESANGLSPDERFLIAATLEKASRASNAQAEKISFSLEVRIGLTTFAKHAKVDDVTAMRRLNAATDALFRRTCRAVYPSLQGKDEIDFRFRWIGSKTAGASFVKISWTAIFAEEFIRANNTSKLDGVKTPVLAFVPT